MALTPEDVINKRFQPTKFREGYDQDEVDDFLDEVVVELRRLHQENDALRKQVETLGGRPEESAAASDAATSDISFTIPETDGRTTVAAVRALQDEMGFADVLWTSHVGKLSLVGAGMRSNPSVASRLFAALADAGVNIEMISTSEIRISVICDQADLEDAVRAVHTAFELDADDEAVVYGGTGR